MTKVLLYLSAIAMGAAAFFAYKNGQTFTKIRDEHSDVNRQLIPALLNINNSVEEITKVVETIAGVQSQVDTEGEKLKQSKLSIAQTEGDLKRTNDELASVTAKMSELETKLKDLPPGFNPQTLNEDLNKMKQEIAELQTQAEAKKTELADAQKKVDDSKKTLSDIVAKIETRKKAFARNGMTARIVAVNADWGFVVVDAGESAGITPDTKLLITRGTQTVGKLTIIGVQGGRTVASVVGDSLAPGMSPAPGDQVMLENLMQ